MSESSRVDLLFEYKRTPDGIYHGHATRIVNGEESWIKPAPVSLPQHGWVSYVISKIKGERHLRQVGFLLNKQGDRVIHRFDDRTVSKIRAGELSIEDLLL